MVGPVFRYFQSGDEGQGLAEYALILAFIAIIAIVALMVIGGQLSSILSEIGARILRPERRAREPGGGGRLPRSPSCYAPTVGAASREAADAVLPPRRGPHSRCWIVCDPSGILSDG